MHTPLTEISDALDYRGPIHLNDSTGAEGAPERNRLRAYWAAVALKAYGNEVGFDTVETIISDLIADLRHFAAVCEDEGGNPLIDLAFDALQESAQRRWYEEAFEGA